MSLAANLRLADLLLMLGLAGCAVPERAPPAAPPVPVSEATWQQVDSDIVNGSLAAKGSAKSFVRHQMERWQLLVTEKAEAAFIPWFSSYVTQQWLTVKVAWYHMSSEDGKALPADRLAAYMQEHVLRPGAGAGRPRGRSTRLAGAGDQTLQPGATPAPAAAPGPPRPDDGAI